MITVISLVPITALWNFNIVTCLWSAHSSHVFTLTLHQEDSMMFSQGSLHDRNGQQHSLWAQLHTGACWLPDVEESSFWRSGGWLICWAAETNMKRRTPGTKDLWPLCWDKNQPLQILERWLVSGEVLGHFRSTAEEPLSKVPNA